jgi:hypothetical protein
VSLTVLLAGLAFVVLVAAIARQPLWNLRDFDQSFYSTIAYDLDRYGVFSNGVFDSVDSTRTAPPPGMFFVPGYPLLVLAAMKIAPRFAAAVRCSVEANNGGGDASACESYATPMRIIHALLLAFGVVAVAIAGKIISGRKAAFWLTGAFATASLAAEAFIFSWVMTEALTFSLYSFFALSLVLAWTRQRLAYSVLSGCLLAALCLTRLSFVILVPVTALALVISSTLYGPRRKVPAADALAFIVAVTIALGSWAARNAIFVGKLGLSEEYGSATLIERFAYNTMTPWEFVMAFPYCTPILGEFVFDEVNGADSMHRFLYATPNSFFQAGRVRRAALVKKYGRLDPVIGSILRDEMSAHWWRHLLVTIPLAWCGMWVGWAWALMTIPLFACASLVAARQRRPLLLVYATPAIIMLGLHAVVANQFTRYNLILIGPFAAGAASFISARIARLRSQRLRIDSLRLADRSRNGIELE